MKSHIINPFDKYDKRIAQDIGEIVTSSNEKKILISGFDIHNKVDLYILSICNIIRDCWGHEIYINCPFFDYIKLKIKLKNKQIKRYKRKGLETYIGASNIIYNNIANNISSFSFYGEIYDNYYNYKEIKRREREMKKNGEL